MSSAPLGRWSRRKLAARQDGGQEARPHDGAVDGATPASPEPLDLPDPDTLQPGDDVAAFMREGVPELLRRKALRRLWANNPRLANLDGLLEYGEDYTDAATVPALVSTAYKVGRGLLAPSPDPPRDEETEADQRPAAGPVCEVTDDEEVPAAAAGEAMDDEEAPAAAAGEAMDPEEAPAAAAGEAMATIVGPAETEAATNTRKPPRMRFEVPRPG